ncbi:DNA sulfur modification protein DndB [Friedmanniella luteola]|uniref:DNA sulfur modification protein DndB n=1 Tax=Friedmanniella luteola TaxID=546871 RepID=A0A1H1ZMN7_9ACTN|nr:DNA sulfur modification protein DndB [Friedmanniella luteola]
MPNVVDGDYAISFPAMRGVQAHREFYVVMVPLRYLPRLFLFDEEEIPAELRAQRALNKNRLPGLVRYIVDNRSGYVFSALTASVDGTMGFAAHDAEGHGARLGVLHIGLGARFLINDGQHRRAAIEEALRLDPSLAEETIPVVIFADEGLARSQQMFADLNRHAVRPAKSIGILYDHREDDASITRLLVIRSDFFRGVVEMERSTLAAASRKLFTLSALYNATSVLLAGLKFDTAEEAARVARQYWEMVVEQFPEWQEVRRGRLPAGDIRRDFIHSHGIALHAMGRVGNTLLHQSLNPEDWRDRVKRIGTLDWSRANTRLWESRALVGGRVSKATNNVTLTTNALRQHLGLSLSPEEQRVEDAYLQGRT